MKIYHYSRIEDWIKMQISKKRGEYVQLKARRRLGQDYWEALQTGCAFGLLDAEPKNWILNKEFNLTWETLLNHIGGRMLLEIEVDDDMMEHTFVLDRGHVEGILYDNIPEANIPEKYQHRLRIEAEAAYLESKIPLSQYVGNESKYNFSLPEVIITKDVPLDKLKVSEMQPLLKKELEGPDCEWKTEFIRDLRKVPELDQWYKKQLEHEAKELSFGMKMR